MAADDKFLQNLQFFSENSACCDKLNALSAIKSITINLRDEYYRSAVPNSFIDDSTGLAKSLITDIRKVSETDPQLKDKFDEVVVNLEVVAEIYRCLRNACAGCKRNQLLIGSNAALLEMTREFLLQLTNFHNTVSALVKHTLPSQNVSLVLQCLYSAVQFLGNLVTDCPENHDNVWSMFGTMLVHVLKLADRNLTNFVCMVLFNCNSENERRKQLTTLCGWRILEEVVKTVCHEDIEWGVYFLEDLMKKPDLFTVAYKQLQDSERSVLLDFILAQVSASLDKGDRPSETSGAAVVCHQLPSESLCVLGQEFKDNSLLILGTSSRQGDEVMDPKLVMKVLAILCTAMSADGDYIAIQEDTDLLKCCVNLLHTMFMIGQQGDNPFTSKKLSEMTTPVTDSDHPTFGLKKDLIRLIGNMVHKNKQNQDKVRELGAIPLILDHTNIDGRNPFILQWSIFTIRNLCEDNPANQDVIANMNLRGVANSAEMLRDFGVEAVVEDGKIVVKKADKS